jgi:uncharacterized protein
MKFLITGATGLVGSEIVSQLLKDGHEVNILTTSKNKLEQIKYKSFYWNISTQEIDSNAFAGVDKIIHLAGASISKRWSTSYKKEILDSRIQSTQLLYNTLSKINHQVNQIISASAIGIYPSSYKEFYTDEFTSYDDSFLSEVTQKWETSVKQFENTNINVSLIRIGIVLSNKGGALLEFLKTIKLGLGAPLGNGNQFQSWIHLQDIAGIFLHVAKNDLQGIYNGVSPYPSTNKKLQQNIATVLNKPFFLPTIPEFVIKLMLGEMHHIVTQSQQVSAYKILNSGYQFKYPTLQKTLENLLK